MTFIQKSIPIIMSIQAKKEGLLRYLGMAIVFLGLIASIVFDVMFLTQLILLIPFIILIGVWFLFIALIKLEINIIVDNFIKIFILLGIITIIVILIGALLGSIMMSILFIYLSISTIILIIGWNFSLSIYKKEKLYFILGIIIYLVLSFISRFTVISTTIGIVFATCAAVLSVLGSILITIAEYMMKKKGLLNYI